MEQQEAIAKLRELCPAGTTVYTVNRYTTSSGMGRVISAFIIKDGEPYDLDFLIVRAGLYKFNQKHGGLMVRGAGMDMGFHVVYQLSRTLHPGAEGGYALKQQWF